MRYIYKNIVIRKINANLIYTIHLLNIPQIMKDKLNLSRSRDRDNTARQVCINHILIKYFIIL